MPAKAESRLTLLILRRLLKSESQSGGGVKCGQYPGRQRHVCVNDLPKVATWIRSGDRPLRKWARQRSTTQATHVINIGPNLRWESLFKQNGLPFLAYQPNPTIPDKGVADNCSS